MDGVSRCLPTSVEIDLGGNPRRVVPITLAGFAEAEAYLLLQRQMELHAKLRNGSAENQRRLSNAAMTELRSKAARVVKQAAMTAWLDSEDGVVFSLRLCLRPELASLAEAKSLFSSLDAAAIQTFTLARDLVSGMDILAHLDWLDSDDSDVSAGFIPWRRLTKWLSLEFHWTPQQIGELTLYQLRVLQADEKELGGRARVSSAEAFTLTQAIRSGSRRFDSQNMPSRLQARQRWRNKKGGRS